VRIKSGQKSQIGQTDAIHVLITASMDFEIVTFLICEQTFEVVGRSRAREESVVLHENADAKLLT